MKEKEPRKFRPYLVCWDNHKCVGHKTKEELNELIKKGKVDWINIDGTPVPPIVIEDTKK